MGAMARCIAMLNPLQIAKKIKSDPKIILRTPITLGAPLRAIGIGDGRGTGVIMLIATPVNQVREATQQAYCRPRHFRCQSWVDLSADACFADVRRYIVTVCLQWGGFVCKSWQIHVC